VLEESVQSKNVSYIMCILRRRRREMFKVEMYTQKTAYVDEILEYLYSIPFPYTSAIPCKLFMKEEIVELCYIQRGAILVHSNKQRTATI